MVNWEKILEEYQSSLAYLLLRYGKITFNILKIQTSLI